MKRPTVLDYGHYGYHAVIAAMSFMIIDNTLSLTHGIVGETVGWTITVVALGSLFCLHHTHDRTLCLRCMTAVPANPSLKAARRRPLLKLTHWADPVTLMKYLVVVAIVQLGLSFVLSHYLTSLINSLTLTGPLAVLNLAMLNHRRLQPWCPYCRRGDGDGQEAPSPDPADRKPAPV